jgi:hypothetical protein
MGGGRSAGGGIPKQKAPRSCDARGEVELDGCHGLDEAVSGRIGLIGWLQT